MLRAPYPRSEPSRRIFPDEEGTERKWGESWTLMRVTVAESSPMRRGLKARARVRLLHRRRRRRIFPDEEGTESATPRLGHRCPQRESQNLPR